MPGRSAVLRGGFWLTGGSKPPYRGGTRSDGGFGSRGVIGAGACLAYPIRAASRSLPPSQACPSSPPPTVRGVRGPRRLEGGEVILHERAPKAGGGWLGPWKGSHVTGGLLMDDPPAALASSVCLLLCSSRFFPFPLIYPPTVWQRPLCGAGLWCGGPNSDKFICMGKISNRLPRTKPNPSEWPGLPAPRKRPSPSPMGLPYTSQPKKPAKPPDGLTLYIPNPKNHQVQRQPTRWAYPTHARTRRTPGTRWTCPARVHPETEGRQAPRSAYPTLTLYMPAPPMATTHALLPRAAGCIACGHSGGNGNNGKRKKKKKKSKEKKEKKKKKKEEKKPQ